MSSELFTFSPLSASVHSPRTQAMCDQTTQRIMIKQCSAQGLHRSSIEGSEFSCNEERISPHPQDSSIQDEHCSIICPQFQSQKEGNKRSRDFCFTDALDYKAPCTMFVLESIDLLSDRFSQLGRQNSEKSVILEDIESDSESTESPRKRLCRGLVRTKKSAKLYLLGSLSA